MWDGELVMTKDIEYFVNLNLKGNEIKDVVVEQVDTLPTTDAVKGRIVYLKATADTYVAGFYYHDGTGWKLIVNSDVTKTLSEKITAIEGTIGSSGTLGTDVANLKTTVFGKDGTGGLVDSVQTNAGAISAIKSDIGTSDSDGLKKRIKDNETNIATLTTSIGTDDDSASVKGRVKVLEGEMDTAQAGILALQTEVGNSGSGLVKKVATLESKVGSAAAEGADATGLFKAVADNAAAIAKKVDKVDGKGLSTNDYTTAEKEKLAGISAGAQVNVIEEIQLNGTKINPTDKTVNINLSAYALKSEITTVFRWKGTVAAYSDLSSISVKEVGDVYHVTAKSAEYVWNGSDWEELGSIIDLSDYYTKTETNSEITTAVGNAKTELTKEIDKKADSSSLATVATTGKYEDLLNKPEVDAALSSTSENAVQNKAIYSALADKVDKLSSKPTAGTYTKVTVTGEGLVEAGAKLTAADMPTEIPSANIKDFTSSVRTAVREEGTLTFGDSETEKPFEHGLNCLRPHVTVYSGTQIVYTGVEAVDANTIKISGNKLGTVTVVVSV